jgi:hypothetical protein
MREEYDFSNAVKNPYTKKLNKYSDKQKQNQNQKQNQSKKNEYKEK